MSQTPDLNVVMEECRKSPGHFQSLHLATCNAIGEPEASYATYIEHQGHYYVYTSGLSAHTGNLAATGRCSVSFFESESEAKHLFARRRLTLQCKAEECHRDSDEFEVLIDKFVETSGNFMGMMRKLTDFHLYRLSPQAADMFQGLPKPTPLKSRIEGDQASQGTRPSQPRQSGGGRYGCDHATAVRHDF